MRGERIEWVGQWVPTYASSLRPLGGYLFLGAFLGVFGGSEAA
jgi:hypothetical protein